MHDSRVAHPEYARRGPHWVFLCSLVTKAETSEKMIVFSIPAFGVPGDVDPLEWS